MNDKRYEFVIIGSGAGGATLARELSQRGREVLVVERGKVEDRVGTLKDVLRFCDMASITKTFATSRDAPLLFRAFTAGGTTMMSCGNGVRCLEEELAGLGITLEEEFAEAEQEMGVAPTAEGLLSEGSERIRWAAQELGYRMDPMPKIVDPARCRKCGQCVNGCAFGAKWTALEYLEEARKHGADVAYNTRIQRVLVEGDRARGVGGIGPDGPVEFLADVVVLAAGALETPVILQRCGVKNAGGNLFADLLVTTYGITDRLNQVHEPSMALVDLEFHASQGFLLSPYIAPTRGQRAFDVGPKGMTLSSQRLLGIMTKIADEPAGRVHEDGSVTKPVTDRDWTRLREGSSIAREILIKTGVKADAIVDSSRVVAAHPGGTAAIGQVVDRDLRTSIETLYVCDASVLPAPPGLPPILTIVALAKRLGKTLTM